MLKETLETIIKQSLQKALDSGHLGNLTSIPEHVGIEMTKNPEHGDRAISIAMKLTKEANLPPRKIAESLKDQLTQVTGKFQKIEIAGPGFINLTLDWDL